MAGGKSKRNRDDMTEERLYFCQLIADGGHKAKSYIKAFPIAEKWKETSVRAAAYNLLKREYIADKVEELKLERMHKLASMRAESREFIKDIFIEGLDLLREGIEMARQCEDHTALLQASDKMSAAADRMGKFLGLNIDPTKVKNEDDRTLDDMTDAELIRMVESQSRTAITSGRIASPENGAA